MPLQKLQFRPGVNREGTTLANEGGWFESDKVRFRSGYPEKIGGWAAQSYSTFIGTCRSLWNWITLKQYNLLGIGTNLKFYVQDTGGEYYDITPIQEINGNTGSAGPPVITASTITLTAAGTVLTVSDTAATGLQVNDFVTIAGAGTIGGIDVNGEYQIATVTSGTTYTVTLATSASGSNSAATITIAYQINTGRDIFTVGTGWDAGPWSNGPTRSFTLGANPIATTSGSNVITVTQTSHGYTTTAGSFFVGQEYRITSLGNTDFTLIGATENAVVTGSVDTTILTVTAVTSGALTVGTFISGSGITSGTYITSFRTGTGGIGTYNLNNTMTAASTTVTGLSPTFTATGVGSGTGTASIAYVLISGIANASGALDITLSGVTGTGAVGICSINAANTGARSIGISGVTSTGAVNTVTKTAFSTNTGARSITLSGVTGTGSVVGVNKNITKSIGGVPLELLNGVKFITVTNANTFTFLLNNGQLPTVNATQTVASAGGSSVVVNPQNPLTSTGDPVRGWGDGYTTGIPLQLRLWSQTNFGETLLFSPRGGGLYKWSPGAATTPAYTTRGTIVTGTDVPTAINEILMSDQSRITICFGCNDYGETTLDPMLIRWSDVEDYTSWDVASTSQAGFNRLSSGSFIVGALQTRQEILVWTDVALYSMQYLGPPYGFGFTILADNISITSPNAMTTANGVTYWMGVDKFYVYAGRVETLPCSLRTYVFNDINRNQEFQFFAGTNEGYSEIWWFYCSANSNVIDRYVIFNYLDRVWYYGTLTRTAWLDSPLREYPQAATGSNLLVYHEAAVDNGETNPPSPISAYVQSSDFDIGDGHNYGFVWQIVPDITFDGSSTPTSQNPSVDFIVRPRQNPGSNYGSANAPTVQSTQSYAGQQTYNVQQFTELVYTRVRGRQMAFRVESNTLGTQWQLGTPRMNVRPDGRR